MTTYAIGDVQGCSTQLNQLVDRIHFDPTADRLWFVGDLVNRGSDSLEVLRYIKQLGPAAQVVLGNHDLFLLAVAEDIVSLRPKDTIQDVLAAEDRAELLDWLRRQPLHYRERSFFMVHAGLLPQWTIDEAVNLAREVEAVLSGPELSNHPRSAIPRTLTSMGPCLDWRRTSREYHPSVDETTDLHPRR